MCDKQAEAREDICDNIGDGLLVEVEDGDCIAVEGVIPEEEE